MNHRLRVTLAGIVLFMISACTSVRKDDPEAEARKFVLSIQQAIATQDAEISGFFDPRLSRETITAVTAILRNTAHEFIQCETAFESASVIRKEEGFQVSVLSTLTSRNLERKHAEKAVLSFYIKPDKGNYVISRLEGDELHRGFTKIKNQIDWLVERELEYRKREPFYAKARALQENCDTVIWYTEYEGQSYFYVVNGTWENYFRTYGTKTSNKAGHKMGLVDQDGQIIVPAEYDLVGTPGFSFPHVVEVVKDGKAGYYDMQRNSEIIPANYDVIIPYGKENICCFVKNDTTYGYFNSAFDYVSGFPSGALEKWVKEFRFLPKHLQLDAAHQSLCEIPAKEHAGFGIVIPPSYLVRTGIFSEIVGGISPTNFAIEGWTDYVETEGTAYTGITETLSALVTTIKNRFLDGREEFYRHDKIVFVGPRQDTLAVSNLGGAGEVSFRIVGDSLLEIKHYNDHEDDYQESYWPDIIPAYVYYRMEKDLKLVPLKSSRAFAQTEFIRLDSSYFSGQFKFFTIREEEGNQIYGYEPVDFISKQTIALMRDEILASYGVKFNDEERDGWLYQYKDLPAISMEEANERLTHIDRHNILFLETLLNEPEPPVI